MKKYCCARCTRCMKSLQACRIGHILDVHIGGAVLLIEPSLTSREIEVTLYAGTHMNDKNYADFLTAKFNGEKWLGAVNGKEIENI